MLLLGCCQFISVFSPIHLRSQFRSIGDQIAEGLGVIAEPEVIRKRISPSDKVCIASAHFPLRDFLSFCLFVHDDRKERGE